MRLRLLGRREALAFDQEVEVQRKDLGSRYAYDTEPERRKGKGQDVVRFTGHRPEGHEPEHVELAAFEVNHVLWTLCLEVPLTGGDPGSREAVDAGRRTLEELLDGLVAWETNVFPSPSTSR